MTLNAERLIREHEEHRGDPKQALWCELQHSFPKAIALCRSLAEEAKAIDGVRYQVIPPRRDVELTRQMTALLGVDRFRELLEEDTKMCFVLGACCAPVTAPTRQQALGWLTWERQYDLQTDAIFMC